MTTFALNNLWTYLQGLTLSQSDRKWLANKLELADSWADNDSRLLDEALARFNDDWGGNGTAMEIADSLRKGRKNTRASSLGMRSIFET